MFGVVIDRLLGFQHPCAAKSLLTRVQVPVEPSRASGGVE
jgi:hypothetical protein